MFVFNISIKKNKIIKIVTAIVISIVIISFLVWIYSTKNKSNAVYVKDEIKQPDVLELSSENYTNILKSSYSDIDNYIGKKIKFSGFVYRLYDFNENQFVLGREMVLSRISETQARVVVVGFLCDCQEASKYKDGTWVEIEGTIQKGFYHSEIPVLAITSIKETSVPDNPYVYPPDSGYVKTETI